jgi:hypothetical protein
MSHPHRAAAVLLAALAAASMSWPAAAQAPAAAPAAAAPAASPAKRALVAKVLELQRPGIEGLANNVAAAPAMQLRQQAAMALQQAVAPERREAAAREIEGDLRKYMDETGPLVRERAMRLAPATIGAILEERFTEEELRQLVALLESPVNRKFQAIAPDLQRALGERLVSETRGSVEPKVRELEQSMARRLGLQPQGQGQGAAPAPAR